MLISYVPFDGQSDYIEEMVTLSIEVCEGKKTEEFIRSAIKYHASQEDYKGWIALCHGEVVGYAYGYNTTPLEVERFPLETDEGEMSELHHVYESFDYVEFAVSPRYKHAGIEATLERRLIDVTSTKESLQNKKQVDAH